ncbi:radical SAM family heme chaperone HemW [uncultured Duncaniella sp.]|uniref:radical SAM family heme chaperone HemW n=1 Tax=uncultured Duncaniella sp. TaxID=2768039 RepID=UPI00262434F0|nr:radical SAM family heme chaperone HemW [uncultured Duncaniella sp.]
MKLYIHIPFCHSKCAYCDFYSTPKREWMDAFIDAAINEWKERSENLNEVIDTLYLGGGTPSSLPLPLLKRLLDALPLDETKLREATIEANPEDETEEWVRFIMNDTPFRRVSMGIQSFSDDELKIIGRRHDAEQAIKAVETMREGGIDNISCDLIYGLPGQDMDSWKRSLSTLISLRPEHLSAYLLSYEPGTRLSAMLERGKITEADENLVEAMYTHLCQATSAAGYSHYEISNFALPGREAIHNSSYWDGSPYIGLGPGAHSWDGEKRWFNPSNLKDYIAHNGSGTAIVEEEDTDNRFNDMLITRLRTAKGVDVAEMQKLFGDEITRTFTAQTLPLLEKGLLEYRNETDTYAIPEEHWLTSNAILLELIRV